MSRPSEVSTVESADGRQVAYAQWGDPDGVPVLSLHGTPGSRLNRHPDSGAVRAAGIRVITYDRPGYGRSDRHPGRTVVDCVADVEAIADALGLERFRVTGASGGGPHCLAVAARLAERVERAACVVGLAPWQAEGLDWFAGMDPANVREFGWALDGEAVLEPALQREVDRLLPALDDDPASLLADFELSDADRAVLADPRIHAVMREGMRESVAQGPLGWVDDDLAFTRPWGFELSEITVPVQVRYGATDVLVPAGHGAWLAAHVPGATVQVDTGAGHLPTPEAALAELQALAHEPA